jgi:antitoxin MazE
MVCILCIYFAFLSPDADNRSKTIFRVYPNPPILRREGLSLSMKALIRKWGNSLALRIPQGLAEELCVRSGSEVRLSLENGALLVTPVVRRRFALERLLASGETANERPDPWGAPMGRECT